MTLRLSPISLGLGALLLCTLSGWTSSPKPASATLSRFPYLQLGTPHSIHVVWRTHGPTRPVVRFGTAPQALGQTVLGGAITTKVALGTNRNYRLPAGQNLWSAENLRLPRLQNAPAGTFQYEAILEQLKPATTYYYAVYDGDRLLAGADENHQFRTHPVAGPARPVRFWVVGDSGTGRATQGQVYEAMRHWAAQQNRPLDFMMHVGDMAYEKGRDVEFQNRFFAIYQPTLRQTVCWPTLGNHEGATSTGARVSGPYFDAYVLPTRAQAGGVPSGTEAYYAFDFANAHFICLNSYDLDRTPNGAMARWLKLDLEKTRADWLIAFWHHPPYTKGSHDSDREKELIEMRTHVMPILEAAGVDLVLTGHSHIYERSMLIDGAYATPTAAPHAVLDDGDGAPDGDGPYRKSPGLNSHQGTVHIVAGHGGAAINCKGTMPVMRTIVPEHGSVIVDIQNDTLEAVMLNSAGHARDSFRIVKSERVLPTRLPTPWQPPPMHVAPGAYPDGEENDPPEKVVELIPRHATWQYVAGVDPAGNTWTLPGFPATGWKNGQAGFAARQGQGQTTLSDMSGHYQVVYIRREFELDHPDDVSELGLMINYQDAFIAYLNGKEILRKGVGRGRGPNARDITSHQPGLFLYCRVKNAEKLLRPGPNVLAIEGYTSQLNSDHFILDPYLLAECASGRQP